MPILFLSQQQLMASISHITLLQEQANVNKFKEYPTLYTSVFFFKFAKRL